MKPILSFLLGISALLALSAAPARAGNDLRQFRVGMSVGDLPATGYQDFACADAPSIKLDNWAGYGSCPKDKLGLHAVSFRYSDAATPNAHLTDEVHGTRVAGHPVLISLLIGDDGKVHGLHIVTDPAAHLYLHKKAFLFANQVHMRYGPDGWHCTDAKPHGDEAPIGDEFIDRTCRKQADGRRIEVVQRLFRHADEPLKDFVSATEVTILAQ